MDWADEKAREFLNSHYTSNCLTNYAEPLAALLREVWEESRGRFETTPVWRRDEVRRVIVDAARYSAGHPDQFFMAGHRYACDEILARLDKL